MKRISRARGFTLIELMVTLAVMAVLAMIALPALRDTIRRNQITTASNALLADLSYARTEAVARGLDVSVCPSQDGQNCDTGTTAYDEGWIVYTYTPGNSKAATAFNSASPSTDVLLRYTQAREGVSIQEKTAGTIISFGTQGQQLPSTGAADLNFVTCHRDGSSGIGVSTATAQGVQLTLGVAGSIYTTPWAAGTTCTAS